MFGLKWLNNGQENSMAKVKTDWEMFENVCPECGKDVFIVTPRRSTFCSKKCESNHEYRTKRFKGVEFDKQKTPEEVEKFKFK